MSENNVEEKEILEEQIVDEEAAEVSINETVDTETVQEGSGEPKASFIKNFCAVVVDELIIGLISVIALYIFDGLLSLGGYFVAQKFGIMFIIFVVVSILYTSIMETGKGGKTFGKKLLNL
jgi:hypothetical protein